MEKEFTVFESHEGPSFWQPKPANGYVVVKASPEILPGISFSQGIQVLPTNSYVRNHTHMDQDEVIYCLEGTGRAVIAEKEHVMNPGTTLVIGRGTCHTFINTGSEELKFLWTIAKPGLEKFFEDIGLPRSLGENAPECFERPQGDAPDERHRLIS